ncbi:putative sensor histidine kinase [Blattamonas nauphoetae]|uniref:histidine kinase n=1 Tax=Blattamonas nauphoetae TaxID=2049346 RepID=A0ABQ9WUF4_9EUKA|nr:putative sensor histidine kinase [Blattamonas nauphoetae]
MEGENFDDDVLDIEDGEVGTADEDSMKTVILDHELTLNTDDKTRLIFHSFSNLLTVVIDAIGKCRVVVNDVDSSIFAATLNFVTEIGKSLTSLDNTIQLLHKLPQLKGTIVRELEQAKQIYTEFEHKNKDRKELRKISKGFWKDIHWIETQLLPIVEIRTKEMMQRLALPGNAWVMYKTETLRKNMESVLLAVARGTQAISGIVFSEDARDKPGEMAIIMTFKGVQEGSVHLPPVFQDVMRDLIMNARKYSLPGATIWADMINDGQNLVVRIKDNGIGIMEDELEHIVDFGVRGSNAANRRTLGGGFGLTKAYFFTRQFGGEFKVQSGIGVGSIFTVTIPCPQSFRLMLPAKNQAKQAAIEKKKRETIPVEDSAIASAPMDTFTKKGKVPS